MSADPSAVGSRVALVTFVQGLRDEFRADPDVWENNDLARFLSALAAWIDDSPGYWSNQAIQSPASQTGRGLRSRYKLRPATSDFVNPRRAQRTSRRSRR
ncbi:DUF7660 family protein [Solirubrobacter phytolaccae]|uniref:DUF7660 family protein n=1 Tax=Solirubrobacter phytolaccae TaxID=1404360 RepID=UPI0022CDE136|nr:hypothetical protein [Solirubrobacter phytolaccae]